MLKRINTFMNKRGTEFVRTPILNIELVDFITHYLHLIIQQSAVSITTLKLNYSFVNNISKYIILVNNQTSTILVGFDF